jgi:hypothetical protein
MSKPWSRLARMSSRDAPAVGAAFVGCLPTNGGTAPAGRPCGIVSGIDGLHAAEELVLVVVVRVVELRRAVRALCRRRLGLDHGRLLGGAAEAAEEPGGEPRRR